MKLCNTLFSALSHTHSSTREPEHQTCNQKCAGVVKYWLYSRERQGNSREQNRRLHQPAQRQLMAKNMDTAAAAGAPGGLEAKGFIRHICILEVNTAACPEGIPNVGRKEKKEEAGTLRCSACASYEHVFHDAEKMAEQLMPRTSVCHPKYSFFHAPFIKLNRQITHALSQPQRNEVAEESTCTERPVFEGHRVRKKSCRFS